MRCHACEAHAHEVHAHAREVHAYKVYADEMHAYETTWLEQRLALATGPLEEFNSYLSRKRCSLMSARSVTLLQSTP